MIQSTNPLTNPSTQLETRHAAADAAEPSSDMMLLVPVLLLVFLAGLPVMLPLSPTQPRHVLIPVLDTHDAASVTSSTPRNTQGLLSRVFCHELAHRPLASRVFCHELAQRPLAGVETADVDATLCVTLAGVCMPPALGAPSKSTPSSRATAV